MSNSPKSRTPMVLGSILALSLIAFGAIVLLLYVVSGRYSPYKYAITIDAGSTHSKAILFKWRADKLNDTGVIQQVDTCDIDPGISSYASSSTQIGSVTDDLIRCIKQLAGQLDRATPLEHTFVYLGATAGMRLLNITDPRSSEQIFAAIRKNFIAARLKVRRISIISGKEEGLFAWIAVNYLSGNLFGRHRASSSFGVLDMGGASAQIAQQVYRQNAGYGSDDETDSVDIRLYGKNYTVNTYSNFCFGTEQALQRYIKFTIDKHFSGSVSSDEAGQIVAPCFPAGYRKSSTELKLADNVCVAGDHPASPTNQYEIIGGSDFLNCQREVDEILDATKCSAQFRYCFRQSFHPKMDTFFAISAYFYLTDVLDIRDGESRIDLQQYLDATRRICADSREKLVSNKRLHPKYIDKYCFQLLYLHRTLTNIYHFDERTWQNLRFTTKISNSYPGWVLGFMIAESGAIPSEPISVGAMLSEIRNYVLAGAAFTLSAVFAIIVIYFVRYRRRGDRRGGERYNASTAAGSGDASLPMNRFP